VEPIHRHLFEGLNKSEARYALELEDQKAERLIVAYVPQPFKLALAKLTWYTPDFLVVLPTHFELHEFKGWWRDDARVKIKVAAQLYPWFQFVGVTEKKKKDGGGYQYEQFGIRPKAL
jgi:hypothetical protein